MGRIRVRAAARLAPLALVVLLVACTTPITLLNGWTTTPFGTSGPEYVVINNIVHLKGAISTAGVNLLAFNLPVGVRPLNPVYVPLDLCNATKGRLIVQTNGDAFIQSFGPFSDAQCFTSLDGASFARDAQGFTQLTMQNGWTDRAFGTGSAGARYDRTSNVVYLKGGLSTAGASAVPFTLPVGFRPVTDVYVPVDLCDSNRGRLYIQPSGVTTVEAEDGTFANAQCFTSLEGASFVVSPVGSTNLTLENGWTNAPFGTSNLAIRNDYTGLYSFKGAVGSGTTGVITTLPEAFRPAATVYTPVDLCNAENGRIVIDPSGVVAVQAESLFSDAQCFTSLDGVQFVINPTAFDTDGDGLQDHVETNTGVYLSPVGTGTNPNVVDSDGDGIDDGDEVLGSEGGLNLPAMGARPTKKNILLEYDWFNDNAEPGTCAAHSHRPTAVAAARITTAFANSPVTNPDGTTGVAVIQDFGQGGAFTGGTVIADADGVIAGGVDGGDFLGYKAANFAANRTGYFHWVLLPHRYNTNSASSGQAEINGDDLIVSLQCFGSDTNVANTIVHELGHNLNLRHGGNVDTNFKPNYNSVMNYQYQFQGVDTNCTVTGDGVLDYSRGTRASLNEASLLETNGICNGFDVDWNFNGLIDAAAVQADINMDGINTSVHNDHDDWANLTFSGITDGDGAPVERELVTEQPVPVEAQR